MKHAHRFRPLRQQREPSPQIELSHATTTITIAAAQLLAQYETVSGDILLILDEDCPYEEQLHLVLVRGEDVIDHLVVGAPYATGVFRELSIEGDALRFGFNGNEVLRVVAQVKGTRLPEGLPPGAARRNGWFAPHHLSLSLEAPAA